MSQTTLIVGASRGIGKELVDQIAADADHNVIASVRKVQEFPQPNVRVIQLDQSKQETVTAAAESVKSIDTLIVNAAIGEDDTVLGISDERWREYFEVNVLGVLRVVRAFLPALRAGKLKRIVLISSTSGSLTRQIDIKSGFKGPYSVTKAGVNMLAVQLHNELSKAEGFTVVPIHPGWVATDMGGEGGMPVTKSVEGIKKVVLGLKLEDSAKFYNWDGSLIEW